MPQNNKSIIQNRRYNVSDLYLKGWPQFKIAEKLGVTQGLISQDLKILRRAWQIESLSNFDKKQSIELIKIDKLEHTYWDAWELSKIVQKKKKAEKIFQKRKKAEKTDNKNIDGELIKQSLEETDHLGDPRYLQGIQWCINKRCEIFGLNAPEKLNIQASNMPNMSNYSYEQLRELAGISQNVCQN